MKNHSSENILTASSHESVRKYCNSIPVDLLIDIFSRVPTKSIARFRCVSKLWADILRCPRLFFTLEANGKLFYYSSPLPQNLDEDSCLVATRYNVSLPEYFPSRYSAPVCGLVLIQGYRKTEVRVICNPATGDFITLPKVLVKPKNLSKVEAKSYPDKIVGFYFGYDPINQQFKVLCMTSSRCKSPNTHLVLTLESGKRSWRRIESKFHFVENFRIRGEVCINGVLYFGANFDQSSVIVSFDVSSEEFGFINTFEEFSLKGCYSVYSLTLFNYKGKLGMHYEDTDPYGKVLFWVLEDAAKHNWSEHLYEVPDLEEEDVCGRFVGMTDAGEMVWSPGVTDPFHLFFYNLESDTFTRVNIQGFKELKEDRYIVLHTFVDYVENIFKDNTLSPLELTQNASCKNRAPAKEEKRVSNNRKTEVQISIPTSNRFDILGSLALG